MGNCFGSERRHRESASSEDDTATANQINKSVSQPLKAAKPKWKSDIAVTEGQLLSKRDEFWETAPAFEGRLEIWQALRAAASALEDGDHPMACAIIESAGISLPNGTLLDAYDELGTRYQLPVYVLSTPHNLVKEMVTPKDVEMMTNLSATPSAPSTGNEKMRSLKVRLSTGQSMRLKVPHKSTVWAAKTILQNNIKEERDCPPPMQRWFFGGKLLQDQKLIDDLEIPRHYIVQVILRENPIVPTEKISDPVSIDDISPSIEANTKGDAGDSVAIKDHPSSSDKIHSLSEIQENTLTESGDNGELIMDPAESNSKTDTPETSNTEKKS